MFPESTSVPASVLVIPPLPVISVEISALLASTRISALPSPRSEPSITSWPEPSSR
ncbi:Uncharacterised protein [Bordetella pertussis]|nr:Uncharacterised protein [Bordetella pertussis]